MGLCASRQQRKADEAMAKTSEFVRFAMLGDIVNVKRMLSKEKMNPNAQDRFGMTALQWAAYTGKLECVKELLAAKASTTVCDQNGRNALHHACRRDQDVVVRFLVTEARIDVNSQSENRETPLHKAVRGKSIKSIEVLLQLGADPNIRNDQNRTPLEELDLSPTTVTDEMPDQISTARVNAQLQTWQEQQTNLVSVRGSPTRRTSAVAMVRSFVRSARGSTATDNSAAIMAFSMPRSQYSDRRSSDSILSSRRAWGSTVAAMMPPSDGIPSLVTPLDLMHIQRRTSSMTSLSSATMTTPSSDHRRKSSLPPQKSLKFAGQRVIRILRVQKYMSCDDKRQMIRLLLERHAKAGTIGSESAPEQTQPSTEAKSMQHGLLHREASGFVLSMQEC